MDNVPDRQKMCSTSASSSFTHQLPSRSSSSSATVAAAPSSSSIFNYHRNSDIKNIKFEAKEIILKHERTNHNDLNKNCSFNTRNSGNNNIFMETITNSDTKVGSILCDETGTSSSSPAAAAAAAASSSVLFSMMQTMPFLMLGQQLASAIGAVGPTSTSPTPPLPLPLPPASSSPVGTFTSAIQNSSTINQTDFSIDTILASDNSRLYRSFPEYSFANHSLLLSTWLQQQNQHQNILSQQSIQNQANIHEQNSVKKTYQYHNNNHSQFDNDIFTTSIFPSINNPWNLNQKHFINNKTVPLNDCQNSLLSFSSSKNDDLMHSFNDPSALKAGSSSPAIPTSSSIKRKPQNRGPRIPFTTHQVTELESKFSNAQYLSSLEVSQLAKRLNLTDNRIRIWFQNRRAREKREHRTTATTATTTAAAATTTLTSGTTASSTAATVSLSSFSSQSHNNETVTLSQSSNETVSALIHHSPQNPHRPQHPQPVHQSEQQQQQQQQEHSLLITKRSLLNDEIADRLSHNTHPSRAD